MPAPRLLTVISALLLLDVCTSLEGCSTPDAHPVPATSSPAAQTMAPGASGSAVGSSGAPRVDPARVMAVECVEGNMVNQPRDFPLGCADGMSATGLTWTGWGGPSATATGTALVNSCEPSCAAGTVRRFPVRLTLSGLTRRGGLDVYTTVTTTYPRAVPTGAARSETTPLLP